MQINLTVTDQLPPVLSAWFYGFSFLKGDGASVLYIFRPADGSDFLERFVTVLTAWQPASRPA